MKTVYIVKSTNFGNEPCFYETAENALNFVKDEIEMGAACTVEAHEVSEADFAVCMSTMELTAEDVTPNF